MLDIELKKKLIHFGLINGIFYINIIRIVYKYTILYKM